MSIEKAGFKISKRVTLPLFKIAPNTEYYFQIESAMFIGKEVKEGRGGSEAKKKEPATLMRVINLETGELGQIICGAVLRGIFDDEYPEEKYVGKLFAIEMHKIVGKDYNGYSVTEIERNEAPAETKALKKK
jgi:hypothetical protein